MDAKGKDSRGLGGGFGEGNLMRPWDSVAGEENEDVDGSSFWWIFFRALFVKKIQPKNICTNIYINMYIVLYIVLFCVITIVSLPTPRVGVSLNQGSQFGKMFLSFRSVHSDVVYNQALLDRIIIYRSHKSNEPPFFKFIYKLGLLRNYTKYLSVGD